MEVSVPHTATTLHVPILTGPWAKARGFHTRATGLPLRSAVARATAATAGARPLAPDGPRALAPRSRDLAAAAASVKGRTRKRSKTVRRSAALLARGHWQRPEGTDATIRRVMAKKGHVGA